MPKGNYKKHRTGNMGARARVYNPRTGTWGPRTNPRGGVGNTPTMPRPTPMPMPKPSTGNRRRQRQGLGKAVPAPSPRRSPGDRNLMISEPAPARPPSQKGPVTIRSKSDGNARPNRARRRQG